MPYGKKKLMLWNAHGTPLPGWNSQPHAEKILFIKRRAWHIAPRTPQAGAADNKTETYETRRNGKRWKKGNRQVMLSGRKS